MVRVGRIAGQAIKSAMVSAAIFAVAVEASPSPKHTGGSRAKSKLNINTPRGLMKKYLAGTIAAGCLLAVHQSAQAMSIGVSSEASGVLLPSLPWATVLTFDELPVGSLPSYQFSGGTLSGSGAVEDTSVLGKYAQPAGDATSFLTVSYPSATGAVHLFFTNPENYFGHYWGSMDSYNSVTFLKNNDQIATYSGTNIASLTELVANGHQQSASSNRFIEFNLGAGFYDEVILSTTGYGFEIDNIAFGDPPLPVFEPGTLIVLGSSLYGLAFVRRRRFR
jgi:hypothetical protein